MQYISISLFDVLYKPDLWKEVCCTEHRLLKTCQTSTSPYYRLCFFSVSGETKELSDERSSIGLVLGRHTSNT